MAEATEQKESAEQVTPASSGKKKVIVVVAVATLLLGAGIPIGYFVFKAPEAPVDQEQTKEVEAVLIEEHTPVESEVHHEDEELHEGEEALGAIVPLDTFLVNLSGGKYIRLQLQAELETPDIPRRFYARVVPMRDQIIQLLTQKTATELEDLSGKEKLKGSIREIMNQQLKREDVRKIYFTQFVIQ